MNQVPTPIYKFTRTVAIALLASLLGISCRQTTHEQPRPSGRPIRINTVCVPSENAVLDNDTAFEDGDMAGLYVVNRINGKMQSLLSSGNHIDNMRFTYHGTWTPSQPIYWMDEQTKADFYLYYPYSSKMDDPRYWTVNVPTDQSSEAAMLQADVLVGRAFNVAPASQAVELKARHMMSRLTITLQASQGMTEEKLREADLKVLVNGLITKATVDIANALVRASGNERHDIRACQTDALTFTVTAVPQEVAEGPLITIVVNGDRYTLRRAVTLKQGTWHHATVKVGVANGNIGVTIGGWTIDNTDYGGTAQ